MAKVIGGWFIPGRNVWLPPVGVQACPFDFAQGSEPVEGLRPLQGARSSSAKATVGRALLASRVARASCPWTHAKAHGRDQPSPERFGRQAAHDTCATVNREMRPLRWGRVVLRNGRALTGETPVPRGMGVPPMSEETRAKTICPATRPHSDGICSRRALSCATGEQYPNPSAPDNGLSANVSEIQIILC